MFSAKNIGSPRTSLQFQFKDGIQAEKKGLLYRVLTEDFWKTKCVNCGEIFSKTTGLIDHYRICKHHETMQTVNIESTACTDTEKESLLDVEKGNNDRDDDTVNSAEDRKGRSRAYEGVRSSIYEAKESSSIHEKKRNNRSEGKCSRRWIDKWSSDIGEESRSNSAELKVSHNTNEEKKCYKRYKRNVIRSGENKNADFLSYACDNCGKVFSSKHMLSIHYAKCKQHNVMQKDYMETMTYAYEPQTWTQCCNCREICSDITTLRSHHTNCRSKQYAVMQDNFEEISTCADNENVSDNEHEVIVIDDEDEQNYDVSQLEKTEEDCLMTKEKIDHENHSVNFQMLIKIPGENVIEVIRYYESDRETDDMTEIEDVAETDAVTTNSIESVASVQINKCVTDSVKMTTEAFKEQKINGQIRNHKTMLSAAIDNLQFLQKSVKLEEEEEGTKDYTMQEQCETHNLFTRTSDRQRPYRCSKCFVCFRYKHKFDIHVMYAHATTTGSIPKSNHVRKIHYPTNNPNTFSDYACSETADAKHDVSTTVMKEPPVQVTRDCKSKGLNFPCDFCHMSFRYLSRCERHLKTVHGNKLGNQEFGNMFRCTECQQRLSDKYTLLQHYNRYHLRNAKRGIKCLGNNVVIEKNANQSDEQLTETSSIPKVKDVSKHLRANLNCLEKTEIQQPNINSIHLSQSNQSRDGLGDDSDNSSGSRDCNVRYISGTGSLVKTHNASKTSMDVYHHYPSISTDEKTKNTKKKPNTCREPVVKEYSTLEQLDDNEELCEHTVEAGDQTIIQSTLTAVKKMMKHSTVNAGELALKQNIDTMKAVGEMMKPCTKNAGVQSVNQNITKALNKMIKLNGTSTDNDTCELETANRKPSESEKNILLAYYNDC